MTKKEVKSVFSKEDLKRTEDLLKKLDENIIKYKKEISKNKSKNQ